MRRLVVVLLSLALGAAPAAAHEGSLDYESLVRSITPRVEGLTVEVVNRDDSLRVTNRSGKDVVIMGYEEEPYVRLLADGTVQVNQRSSATYLNEERFGGADVPATVDAKAAPRWKTIDRSGRLSFHDHRMHWMNKEPPEKVAGKTERAKIFDWKVPLAVAGNPGAIAGELFWTPQEEGGAPVGAIVGAVAVVLAGIALVLVVRRRRGQASEAW